MQETQALKTKIISALDFLPLESLKILAEFVEFLRMKTAVFKQKPSQTVSQVANKEHPLLNVAGTWEGDDFEECLEMVYQFRGEAQF